MRTHANSKSFSKTNKASLIEFQQALHCFYALLRHQLCQNPITTLKRPYQRPANKRRPPQLEDKMKLVSRFEAEAMNTKELRGLLRVLFNELAKSNAQSPERRNTLASLETVQRELVNRM